MIRFDLPKNDTSIIKVIGVGGGGCNAVNHMFNEGIQGVDFIICNTDAQSLNQSPIPLKIQLGASLTEGRGAGSLPSVGRNAALENIEDIRALLERDTKMLFVTAGMGGGTGTGAAPVIAAVAKEMDILTVGIVTIPFSFEGSKRRKQADEGIKELREHVDSLLVICNDKLRELYGDLPLSKAFGKADNILTTAAKGIAEIITVPGYINVDFEDVKTVMRNSGVAIMGSGLAEGEDRALKAVEEALTSPLLNDNNIDGASNILLYIASGNQEVTMDEVSVITDYIQAKAGQNAEIIWGNGSNPSFESKIAVTLVATGFEISGSEKKNQKEPESNKVLIGTLGEPDLSRMKIDEPLPYSPPQISPILEEISLITDKGNNEPGEPDSETDPESDPDAEPEHQPEPFNTVNSEPIVFELYQNNPDAEPEPETDHELRKIVNEYVTPPPVRIEPEPLKKEHPEFISASLDAGKTSNDRKNRLRELSLRLKTPDGIDQLEREPAYMRLQVDLTEPRHSSESEVSHYSLAEDTKGGIELKQNNSYLHDQPD
ncbi:MAG: cell division protein FtsZ [Bacteroidetes bacterium]|nr:cell division protein FtsZ [Bacteroidota bacterium]